MSASVPFASIRQQFVQYTPEQQWLLVYYLLHDLLSQNSDDEVPLVDPEGATYRHILTPQRRHELVEMTSEQWEALGRELHADAAEPGIPLREALADSFSAERRSELEQRYKGITDPTAMHPNPELLEKMRAGDLEAVQDLRTELEKKPEE